ncbi:MAG TPA: HupE/UreJ family protein, partial [Kofleriaceae bacterium]
RRLAVAAGVALALGLGGLRPAHAHPLDIGYLRITTDGDAVSVALDLHVNAAARLIGADPAAMDASTARRRATELAEATFRGAPLTTALGPCRWTAAAAAAVDQTASITSSAACPGPVRAIRWDFPFIRQARVSPTFQVLVQARLAGESKVAIVDRTRPSLELAATGAIGLSAFVWTGVEHIGAAPDQWHGPNGWKLPDGIDHILFLLALMLAGGTLARILGIVSGFTLGHSITLALSALHVVRPPAQLIEPLIALSIALVAAEAFAGRFEGHRWKVASGFGLIHGFGFATALHQLDLSTSDLVSALLGYNLGVELGQVAIVLATAPLILYLQRHRRLHPIVRALAAAIFLAGIYWFFQRL